MLRRNRPRCRRFEKHTNLGQLCESAGQAIDRFSFCAVSALMLRSGGIVKRLLGIAAMVLVALVVLVLAKEPTKSKDVNLSTSKVLHTPSLGRIGPVNSFPVTIALSSDGRYAALLNFGYGTQKSQAHQSIAVLDLKSDQITDFPDDRLAESAKQTYFIGLA